VAASPKVSTEIKRAVRRPFRLSALIGYSLFLGIITFFPQLYYVLFALLPHPFPIGPHAKLLGQVWYSYRLNGRQGGYLPADSGTLAGALAHTFMLGPLYTVTGMGLWLRHSWVVPIGLMTGAMIFSAVLYFFLEWCTRAPAFGGGVLDRCSVHGAVPRVSALADSRVVRPPLAIRPPIAC